MIANLQKAFRILPEEAPKLVLFALLAGLLQAGVAVGMTAAFEILTIDPEKKRIGVAMVQEGLARAEEVREYAERTDAESSEGFGSLADKLRGALTPRDE